MINLTAEDCRRLRPLLESAIAEVDSALDPDAIDAMIQPDTVESGMSLLESRDWAINLLQRIDSCRQTRNLI